MDIPLIAEYICVSHSHESRVESSKNIMYSLYDLLKSLGSRVPSQMPSIYSSSPKSRMLSLGFFFGCGFLSSGLFGVV
jgi:hypothetical protein